MSRQRACKKVSAASFGVDGLSERLAEDINFIGEALSGQKEKIRGEFKSLGEEYRPRLE